MSNGEDSDLLYGMGAIARYLGMREKQARNRCDRGQIPTFKIGSTVCARKSKLSQWIFEQEAASIRQDVGVKS